MQDDKKRDMAQSLVVPNIMITPVASLDPETRMQMGLQSPEIAYQVFVEGNPELRIGFEIVPEQPEFHGKRLTIRSIARWPWKRNSDTRLHLALQMVKP